mmetsp:Transcript_67274/g.121180  ORF Transcript_67274/g.121180 Transcript_67274/m.121180 type:complete len:205 (+) Transcript_67274:63-677(+)
MISYLLPACLAAVATASLPGSFVDVDASCEARSAMSMLQVTMASGLKPEALIAAGASPSVPAPGPAPPAVSALGAATNETSTTTTQGAAENSSGSAKTTAALGPYKSTTGSVPTVAPLASAIEMPSPNISTNRTGALLDCVLSSWSSWGDCATDGDKGMETPFQTRTRKILQPTLVGGKPCALRSEVRACILQSIGTAMNTLGR